MFRRLSTLNFAIPLLVAGVEDDSVNLLQTTVHKHTLQSGSEKKKCVVKGDPHVKLWSQTDADGARLGLYGTYADYWLVNTDQLKVMGRIGGVEEFDMGVVKGVAVTGPLMEDKVLVIPTLNNGHIKFGDDVLDTFPWTSPGGTVTITNGIIPNYNMYGGKKPMRPRDNGFTIKMGDKAEIQLNQDVFQHLQILADPDIVANDTGDCAVECADWFKCQDPICDLDKSLFEVEHPECGHVIIRVPCGKVRHKVATVDCNARFEGSPPSGMAIQNCIEDCCSDRDQCPDRGKGDGKETCLIFGDPHIKGFDAKATSTHTYSPIGTHYLVKSDHIQIQANYASGDKVWAQMQGIAITGGVVSEADSNGKHDVLYFRALPDGGGIFVNDKNVMPCTKARECTGGTDVYTDPNGHFNITYGDGDDIPSLLKEERPVLQRNNVHVITFKEGARVAVHEGEGQAIYMNIDSMILKHVSGECGNMNGNPHDDGHDSFDASNAHCALKDEIFIPNGTECKQITGGSTCRKFKDLKPYKKQCFAHFGMKGSWKKYTQPERRIAKDCMKDCCMGGTCPSGKGDDTDEAY